jgi:sugar/nucleoside kinase (ribokinase family)
MGSVGKDPHAKLLEEANVRAGVRNALHTESNIPTGTCGVIVTGKHRWIQVKIVYSISPNLSDLLP